VRSPGLYALASTLRVSDAIVAAGGLTEAADPHSLPNLRRTLKDAKQIAVPSLMTAVGGPDAAAHVSS
jgi:competence protein ComEA